MSGLQSMRVRLLRPLFLVLGLLLIAQFPDEVVRAAPLQATSISLSMSNPSCVQVQATSGACTLQLGYLVASGSDPSFSRLEVLVDGKLRMYMGGFFESSAYLIPQMLPGGLSVACGRSNSSGKPDYGKAYSVAAKAYMVDGTSASDSMTVFCPAYDGVTYLPLIRK
jgi:hypothetical protein